MSSPSVFLIRFSSLHTPVSFPRPRIARSYPTRGRESARGETDGRRENKTSCTTAGERSYEFTIRKQWRRKTKKYLCSEDARKWVYQYVFCPPIQRALIWFRPVNTSLIVIHEGSCSFAHTSSQRLISFPVTVIRCRIVARGPGGRGGWRGGSKLSESVKNEMRRVWNCKETLVMNDVN